MTEEDPGAGEVARRVGPPVAGSLLGWLVGDPTGIVGAGLGALAGLALERRKMALRRADLLWEIVNDLTELNSAVVEAWATEREQRLDFTCLVFQTAMDSVSERKIHALGRVLAQGLRDDLWLDHGRVIVNALRELEEPHIEVLHAMIADLPPAATEKMGEGAWSRRQLQAHLSGFAQSIIAIGAVLVSAGLLTEGLAADDDAEGYNPAWQVTNFGRDCHQYLLDLRTMAEEED